MQQQDQMKWLISTIGLGDAPVKRFSVEYLVIGGGYSATTMSASTLSELVEMTLEHNTHKKDIVLMTLDPVEKGVKKSFHLMNHARI
jgi:hypothetical protein